MCVDFASVCILLHSVFLPALNVMLKKCASRGSHRRVEARGALAVYVQDSKDQRRKDVPCQAESVSSCQFSMIFTHYDYYHCYFFAF